MYLLNRLLEIIVKPNHVDQSTLTSIIKNLYPSAKVPGDIVAKIVCCLGPSKTKPSPATQNSLLRWLILVYEDLEDPTYLPKLYSILSYPIPYHPKATHQAFPHTRAS
jgi:centromere protein I